MCAWDSLILATIQDYMGQSKESNIHDSYNSSKNSTVITSLSSHLFFQVSNQMYSKLKIPITADCMQWGYQHTPFLPVRLFTASQSKLPARSIYPNYTAMPCKNNQQHSPRLILIQREDKSGTEDGRRTGSCQKPQELRL